MFATLNDPSTSLHRKYELIYEHLYYSNGSMNDQFLKLVFSHLDDGSTNLIIKADLSYLLSTSKNKAHIPILDNAISKINDPAPSNLKSDKSQKKFALSSQ